MGKKQNQISKKQPLQPPEQQPFLDKVENIETFLSQYKILETIYNYAQEQLLKHGNLDNSKYIECINRSSVLIKFLDNVNPFVTQRHKEEIKQTYYISSELLVRTIGLQMERKDGFKITEKNTLFIAIAHARKCLTIEPFHKPSQELIKIVLLYLTLFNPNPEENLGFLQQAAMHDPCDYQLQYNLGFMHHRANKLDDSIKHYKLAIGIIDLHLDKNPNDDNLKQFKIKCFNGLGSVYYSVQDRDLALYFFNLAYTLTPNDPDINNQIGVVYTELRVVDKAIFHYMKGIKNVDKAHISTDREMLAASMHMNMGLAKCYECDFMGAIECYNQALKYKPRLSLAYQNKLLDSNYISHLIDDPMYIANLHKNINKIYPLVIDNYKIGCPNYQVKKELLEDFKSKEDLVKKNVKINIGFVSGDFICHPVSYFIHSILKYINYDLFNVHCYSAKVVSLKDMFPKCEWTVVKNKSAEEFKNIIQSHNIDILFDLSAHTGDNRLDTFVLKPAPIQISYCGYPNSSGIRSMDYRITDNYCDGPESQKYYQEKLVFMEKCFLAYSPATGLENLPELDSQPCIKNDYVTFGCFNRFNKINNMVISVWEKILVAAPTARFVIKTKEFQTDKIRKQFFDGFKNKEVIDRITILPYSDTYQEHLVDYNKMDISLDTFPYCGTTTSCESLLLGVPILTLFDNVRHYHSQNVTTSLMKNCGLDEYVTMSQEEYINKAVHFANNYKLLANLKRDVRKRFVNGPICNYTEFCNLFENKLLELYKNHKW